MTECFLATLFGHWQPTAMLALFADRVRELAFEIPAPNPITPQLIALCIMAKRSVLMQQREMIRLQRAYVDPNRTVLEVLGLGGLFS